MGLSADFLDLGLYKPVDRWGERSIPTNQPKYAKTDLISHAGKGTNNKAGKRLIRSPIQRKHDQQGNTCLMNSMFSFVRINTRSKLYGS
jgi:hypothetical protein